MQNTQIRMTELPGVNTEEQLMSFAEQLNALEPGSGVLSNTSTQGNIAEIMNLAAMSPAAGTPAEPTFLANLLFYGSLFLVGYAALRILRIISARN